MIRRTARCSRQVCPSVSVAVAAVLSMSSAWAQAVDMTAEEALKSLLMGTELEAIYVDEKTVMVAKRKIAGKGFGEARP